MPKKPDPKALLNLQAQHERLAQGGAGEKALLGVDYGEKFCGLAVAPDGQTVLPAAVVETSKLSSALESLVVTHKPEVIVFGLPVSSDGTENHICDQIRALVKTLTPKFKGLRVALINERFSSQKVLSPDKSRIDDLAAMQILQFYLDSLAQN